METISLEQSKQLDIVLSKLKDLEQQHEESLHRATEIGTANEAMIDKLEKELSTANTEVSISIINCQYSDYSCSHRPNITEKTIMLRKGIRNKLLKNWKTCDLDRLKRLIN